MPIDQLKFPNLARILGLLPDDPENKPEPDENENDQECKSSSDATETADTTNGKKVHKGDLFRKLGVLAGKIYQDEKQLANSNPPSPVIRVYTFTHKDLTIVPKDITVNTETLSVPFNLDAPWTASPEFQTVDTTWLIGYDIETQSYNDSGYYPETDKFVAPQSPHCVSHQWYFNFQGVRFGFIFLTELRITQNNFVSFIDGVVPDIKNPAILKKIKVYAHFSVYESGWMLTSPPPKPEDGEKKPSPFATLINESNDEWCGSTTLRSYMFKPAKTSTGKLSKAKAEKEFIKLEFGDSRRLQAGSLQQLGDTISIEKVKLDDGVIENMADFLKTNPLSFCEYAIIDSIITAEAHLYFFHKYKTCMLDPSEWNNAKECMRMPGYSSQFFKGLYKKRYGDTWKQYLGYDSNGMTLAHKAFVHFYHGGRNDVLSVGPRGEAHYLDLHSAYLTSVVMLNDYNFSKVRITTGSGAEKRLKELYADGPFQVVGIECSFRFKDKAKPIFPVRIDEAESLPGTRINYNSDGIIYPRSGKSNLTMPEYWVAQNNGLLDKIIVHRVIEFQKLPARWLSSEVLRLLKLRKDSDESDKLFYKNILNFFYGKTAQGVKKSAAAIKKHNIDLHVNVSSMTCYPLASYITGFCRATVGELLQHNDCYGITTDGFITPVSRENLVIPDGSLCDQVQQELHNGGFNKNFIGCDASGQRSLFLKTRGYLLIGLQPPKEDTTFIGPPTLSDMNKKLAEIGPPPRKVFLQKMAAMGVQVDKKKSTDPIGDFLRILQKGYNDKKFFLKLNKVREAQKKANLLKIPATIIPSEQIMENVKADMTFDMKHLPVNPTMDYFEWDGEKYPFVSFETKPLDSAMDFHILRALRGRDYSRGLPKGLTDPTFPFIDPATEINANSLDAAYYDTGWKCAQDVVKHLDSTSTAPTDDVNAYLDGFKNVLPQALQHIYSSLLTEQEKTKAFTSGFNDAWDELQQKKEYKAQSKKPIQKPDAQTVTTAKKIIKTMKIDGVQREQAIAFDSKTIISLLLRSKAIPTYMAVPDYQRMLERYESFRNGSADFNELDTTATDYEDTLNESDGFADDQDFSGDFDGD